VTDFMKFLWARYDDEAALAEAASPGPWAVNDESDEVLAVDGITVAEGFALSGRQLRATTEHIARHDPARVLRGVEAKRQITKVHFRRRSYDWDEPGVIGFECAQCLDRYPCATLRLLALPYADHEAYREEWKP
jgi:hypothetical protein